MYAVTARACFYRDRGDVVSMENCDDVTLFRCTQRYVCQRLKNVVISCCEISST